MDKKFKIIDLDLSTDTITAEYSINGQTVRTSFNHQHLENLDAARLKKFCADHFPYYAFQDQLNNVEKKEEKKREISQEVLDIKNIEFDLQDILEAEGKSQKRENFMTTMYGTKYNIMSTKHIILETLREVGLIK